MPTVQTATPERLQDPRQSHRLLSRVEVQSVNKISIWGAVHRRRANAEVIVQLTITWQRTYATARLWWLTSDGRVDWAQLPEDTVYEGEQLGGWVKAQRAGFSELDQDRQDLLTAIGIAEDQELAAARAAAAAKPKVSRADRFAQGLAALAQFVEREGHAVVKRARKEELEMVTIGAGGQETVETVSVSLGTFLNNTKAGRAKLTPGQLAQLAEHGVEWA